jgi:acetyl-CoA C-acetyltransferase
MAVPQRFNALTYPNAVFQGQLLSIEDVLNSRVVNDPPQWLKCVMPCEGAVACLSTSAERAKSWPHPPVYLLAAGAGVSDHGTIWQSPRMTTTPVVVSARKAYEMAGYAPKDIQFAECDDWYTILAAMSLEDAGFCQKGEIGAFCDSVDTTYQGRFPVNPDGGQISAGQPVGGAGGFR